MPRYCLKMIFYNSKSNLGIKTAKTFGGHNSVFQFKIKLLLLIPSGTTTSSILDFPAGRISTNFVEAKF